VLFADNAAVWNADIEAGKPLKLGEQMGCIKQTV
jgi:hypothetical protein